MIEFYKELYDFPWNNHSNSWGFKEGSGEFELLSTKVPAPNGKIRKIRGLRAVWGLAANYSTKFSSGEAPEVILPPRFSFDDIAKAVEEAAFDQDAGGNICHVMEGMSRIFPLLPISAGPSRQR